jgi:hypothetical protein
MFRQYCKASESCGSYGAGHFMQWIQGKKSLEAPPKRRPQAATRRWPGSMPVAPRWCGTATGA